MQQRILISGWKVRRCYVTNQIEFSKRITSIYFEFIYIVAEHELNMALIIGSNPILDSYVEYAAFTHNFAEWNKREHMRQRKQICTTVDQPYFNIN